jgi:hypothetical protein
MGANGVRSTSQGSEQHREPARRADIGEHHRHQPLRGGIRALSPPLPIPRRGLGSGSAQKQNAQTFQCIGWSFLRLNAKSRLRAARITPGEVTARDGESSRPRLEGNALAAVGARPKDDCVALRTARDVDLPGPDHSHSLLAARRRSIVSADSG